MVTTEIEATDPNGSVTSAVDKTGTDLLMKVNEQDMLTIERATAKMQLTLSEAKRCLAESETAELQHKMAVMQLFVKYGLNEGDTVTQDGTIVRKNK